MSILGNYAACPFYRQYMLPEDLNSVPSEGNDDDLPFRRLRVHTGACNCADPHQIVALSTSRCWSYPSIIFTVLSSPFCTTYAQQPRADYYGQPHAAVGLSIPGSYSPPTVGPIWLFGLFGVCFIISNLRDPSLLLVKLPMTFGEFWEGKNRGGEREKNAVTKKRPES